MRFDPGLAETLSNARDERELGQAMLAVADRLGARYFQALRFSSTEHGKALDEMGSYAEDIVETFSAGGYPDKCDPVMQHLRCSSTPILWNKDYYDRMAPLARRDYEILADFGIGFGGSYACHLGPFRHFTLQFAWPHRISSDPRLLTDLLSYAVYAEPAFYRVWSQAELAALRPREAITERELQTLFESSRGLKLPAIAAKFHKSARTFEGYAQNVMAKLGASTLIEAVSIAERLQLFDELRAREAAGRQPRRYKF